MFVDTHSHLTFPEYDSDREDVIKRAFDAGVAQIISIGSGRGLEDNIKSLALAKEHENIYSTIGFHPHDATQILEDKSDPFARIEELAKSKKVVAVGEMGLDYHYIAEDKAGFAGRKKDQIECFVRLLGLARKLKLPVIIHDRDAHNDTMFTIQHERGADFGGVLHCFSGNVSLAKKVLDLGLYISVTGAVTFKKKADVLHEVVKFVPIEKLLIETDCPFIAPEPYRGKRNEPSFVTRVAEKIAELKKLSIEDVGRITTLNARRLFHLRGEELEARIAYPIRNSLYLNITNKCTLSCVFCPKRSGNFEVKGHNLKLEHEPDIEDVFKAMGDPGVFKEVVFCGFGEPTMRLELLKVIARRLKESGVRVRLNTDGLANLVHGRDVISELAGLVDEISVSINAQDASRYADICPSKYGAKAFDAVCDFIRAAKGRIPVVSATAVNCPGVDMDAVRRLVEKELKCIFREREYQEVG